MGEEEVPNEQMGKKKKKEKSVNMRVKAVIYVPRSFPQEAYSPQCSVRLG